MIHAIRAGESRKLSIKSELVWGLVVTPVLQQRFPTLEFIRNFFKKRFCKPCASLGWRGPHPCGGRSFPEAASRLTRTSNLELRLEWTEDLPLMQTEPHTPVGEC